MLKNVFAIVALGLILVAVNASILAKEQHLAGGRVVFLELAPVDPRSLMQGDYMALRFAAAADLGNALPEHTRRRGFRGKVDAEDGWAIMDVDDRGVGRFAGLAESAEAAAGQINLAYRVRSGTIKFATNAFFFEEGTGKLYERARYGEFRVNQAGEPLLVGMRDEKLMPIESGVEARD